MSRRIRILLAIAAALALVLLAGCGDEQASLDGTKWRLVSWSISSQQASDFTTTMAFKSDQLTGRAPVNSYGGTYETRDDGSIELGEINRTLMAGPKPEMKAEDAYFKLLEQVSTYRVDGSALTLMDAKENELLVFERE